MFDEMSFLFESNELLNIDYPDDNSVVSEKVFSNYNTDKKIWENKTVPITIGDSKNYIKSKVNNAYTADKKNPYIKLLTDFDGQKNSKSTRLRYNDFMYLRDIGVYPINRLMVLRRFSPGVIVRTDLNEVNVEPISTVIGWVKADSDFLNFSFSEVWKEQGSDQMLHVLLNSMISKEFGLNINEIFPVPGWGVGLVFGFLSSMGLVNSEYGSTNIPLGDPNVLKESITRPHEEFGLQSNFTFTLETVYEQKFIGNKDITSVVMEILYNLTVMGTSPVKYIGNANSEIIKNLTSATNNPKDVTQWVNLINSVIDNFVNAIQDTISKFGSELAKIKANETTGKTKPSQTQQSSESQKKTKTEQTSTSDTSSGNSANDKSEKSAGNSANDKSEKSALSRLIDWNDISKGKGILGGLIKSILASTVAKYVWPLRGSIAMLTGDAATPWHLTIGNPYAPLLSMSNVYVTEVSVTFKGDMMYNDIPKYIEVKVSMKQGRNMGGNEIYNMFGIEYQRIYKDKKK